MVQAQVEIPDELYARASAYSREQELPLAEVVRRSLELLLDAQPGEPLT